jgi:integrase
VVSKILGHANIMVTYNKYIHVIDELKINAMDMVDVC